MAEEAKKETAAKPVFYVENMVRRVGTRLHRAKSATRHRFKLYVAGKRVLRKRKLPLTEEEFEANSAQIKDLVLSGRAALWMPDGTRVTSLPDRRLVYRRPDGAIKIDEEPQPDQPTPRPNEEPELTPTPPTVEVVEEPEEPAKVEATKASEEPTVKVENAGASGEVKSKTKTTKRKNRKG